MMICDSGLLLGHPVCSAVYVCVLNGRHVPVLVEAVVKLIQQEGSVSTVLYS